MSLLGYWVYRVIGFIDSLGTGLTQLTREIKRLPLLKNGLYDKIGCQLNCLFIPVAIV